MPRRKVREYQAKRLFSEHFKRISGVALPLPCVQVTAINTLEQLAKSHPWLLQEKLVVKPDMLFGKRGMSGLVLLNATFQEAATFVAERMGKKVEMGGLVGVVDHFIVEPFIVHKEEYYFSIICSRDKNTISFSSQGGIHIEENWDKVRHVDILVGQPIAVTDLSGLFESDFLSHYRNLIVDFLHSAYKVFEDLNFHFLEMNPFTVVQGQPRPLDMRAELDDCAHFKNANKWKIDGALVEFPNAFGKVFCEEEKFVHSLDEQTGASLKLTLLNPQGSIWAMIAGGGASVIYADTVADLGCGSELGNYGEYSGDPSEEETYQYAMKLLSLATKHPNPNKRKALLIGGAIANFTDVAATFSGIIRALREYAVVLAQTGFKVFVRRGGPNYKVGLQRMRDLEKELHIPFEVFGPEVNMTKIVKLAIGWIKNQ